MDQNILQQKKNTTEHFDTMTGVVGDAISSSQYSLISAPDPPGRKWMYQTVAKALLSWSIFSNQVYRLESTFTLHVDMKQT